MADRIRKINIDTGTVHAVITTDELPATSALYGIAVSANGTLYASDFINSVVYKIFEDGRVSGAVVGKINTPGDIVSSGLLGSDGNTARLKDPGGLCVDASDNIYIADAHNHKVKRLSPSGRCQTLVGTGVAGDSVGDNGLLCQLDTPACIAVDRSGVLYVPDAGNHKIKKIWPSGKVVVLAGSGNGTAGFANGNGNNALFNYPLGICVDQNGKVYVADALNYRIRQIDEAGNVVTLAGLSNGFIDDFGNVARFGLVYNICIDNSGVLFVLDYGNTAVRRVLNNGKVNTLMHWNSGTNSNVSAIAVDKSGFLYILEKNI